MAEEDKTIMSMEGSKNIPVGGSMSGAPPKGKLICLDDSMLPEAYKGIKIHLNDTEQTIGRGDDNTIPVKFQKLSRNHARIYPSDGGWRVEDLKSTNGVWVNDVRVDTASLKSGDYVKIGAIPFQFILEQPDLDGVLDDMGGQSEGTVMFGSVGAADMLMDAEAETVAAEDPNTEPNTGRGKPARKGVAAARAAPKKGPGGMIGIVVGVVVVAVAGAWFMGLLGDGGLSKALEAQQRKVKNFVNDYEVSAARTSQADLDEEMGILQEMSKEADQVSQKFPKNGELKLLRAKVQFLLFERRFRSLLDSGKAGETESLVRANEQEIESLKAVATPEMATEIQQILDLVDLSRDVARIKRFREQYPKPEEGASAPDAQVMGEMREVRRSFVNKKKDPRVNTALSVSYPLFGRLVSQVDQYDLLLLDRWKAFLGE